MVPPGVIAESTKSYCKITHKYDNVILMRKGMCKGWKLSPETRQKIAAAKMGELNPMFGTVSPKRKVELTKEELVDLYITQGRSVGAIAKLLGLHYRTIGNWLRRYSIRLTSAQISERQFGSKNSFYKGGRTTSSGYVNIRRPDHPEARLSGYVREHRLVVEEYIGRFLTASEKVHHINWDKQDNGINNLLMFGSASEHTAFHQWMQRVGSFYLGLISNPPAPLAYKNPVFFRGQWVYELSIDSFKPASAQAVA